MSHKRPALQNAAERSQSHIQRSDEPTMQARATGLKHSAAARGSSLKIATTPAGATRIRRTQAERREEAERRLLDAALHIVAARGSVRMTLAEVGEAAGYSRGLAAHRFGSKSGLLKALAAHIEERFRALRDAQRPYEAGLAAIHTSIRTYCGREEKDWVVTRALLVMMTDALTAPLDEHEHIVACNRSSLAHFEQHIRIGIEQGRISPKLDPKVAAVLLLGAIRGVLLQSLSDPQVDVHRAIDALPELVDRVLLTSGSSEPSE